MLKNETECALQSHKARTELKNCLWWQPVHAHATVLFGL